MSEESSQILRQEFEMIYVILIVFILIYLSNNDNNNNDNDNDDDTIEEFFIFNEIIDED